MTRKAIIVASPRAAHQNSWGGAFADGLRLQGWQAELRSGAAPCDLLVLWGVRQQQAIAAQVASGGEVCILERGYVGDRFAWTSVSFGGGLNGRGIFRGPLHDTSRWNQLFADRMQSWRQRDGYALIMGQVLSDASLRDLNPHRLWGEMAQRLQRQGHDVRFRPHPLGGGWQLPGVKSLTGVMLDDALAGASRVVTINSNSGVDAVLAGVPTVTLDQGSMAFDVTGHDAAPPPMPDRAAWATALAWKQWSLDEIASGFCWDLVGSEVLC